MVGRVQFVKHGVFSTGDTSVMSLFEQTNHTVSHASSPVAALQRLKLRGTGLTADLHFNAHPPLLMFTAGISAMLQLNNRFLPD